MYLNKNSTRVISICNLAHKDVWKLTNELILKFIEADEYFVYVPENEVSVFESFTNKQIKVVSQSSLDVGFTEKLENKMLGTPNESRLGWYLQQFYKIQALIESNCELNVIWDADCVPVKKINLFNIDQNPIYMFATELHKDYFTMISRLLDLDRIQNQSFVIPGFPIRQEWVLKFKDFVEKKHKKVEWFEAIIEVTDLSLASGFSETETLGTWVANMYPNSWETSILNWDRYGQSNFGYARDFNPEKLILLGSKKNLDIISFENWDKITFFKKFKQISDRDLQKIKRK